MANFIPSANGVRLNNYLVTNYCFRGKKVENCLTQTVVAAKREIFMKLLWFWVDQDQIKQGIGGRVGIGLGSLKGMQLTWGLAGWINV